MLKIIKKHLLTTTLLCSSILVITAVSFASTTTITKKIPHEMLNTGVVFAWDDGKGSWQNGIAPNTSIPRSFTVNIGNNRTDISVTAYNGKNFEFRKEETSHWNITKRCTDKSTFNKNYIPYSISSASLDFTYDKDTGNLTINQQVLLSSSKLFDVAYYVKKGQQQEVYDYLGDNIPSSITSPMDKMLEDANVKGYLYFCPVIINYNEVSTEVVETPDPVELKAQLELPKEGETNTPYIVKDITQMPSNAQFQSSKLEISTDGGKSYAIKSDWDKNTQNAQIEEIKKIATEYTYRLTVFLKNGQSSEDIKSIIIKDSEPEIQVEAEAHLAFDREYTYMGHPAMMYDQSVFYVTDEKGNRQRLTAQEAYAKGIATNSYKFDTPNTDYKKKSFSKVESEVTWYSSGTKIVTLEVTLKNGVKLIEEVEVGM